VDVDVVHRQSVVAGSGVTPIVAESHSINSLAPSL
jgi:hypothetical protein